jgi:hypothetical protein
MSRDIHTTSDTEARHAAKAKLDAAFIEARLEQGLAAHPVGHVGANSLRNWVLKGIPPGGFLTAVLCNDLVGAYAKADSENLLLMAEWAALMAYVPHSAKNLDVEEVVARALEQFVPSRMESGS